MCASLEASTTWRTPARLDGAIAMPEKSRAAIATSTMPKSRLKAEDEIERVRKAPMIAPGIVAAANFQPSERSTRRCRR